MEKTVGGQRCLIPKNNLMAQVFSIPRKRMIKQWKELQLPRGGESL